MCSSPKTSNNLCAGLILLALVILSACQSPNVNSLLVETAKPLLATSTPEPNWQVVFVSQQTESNKVVYSIGLDGSSLSQITEVGAYAPFWSPNRQHFAFRYYESIHIMSADGTHLITISDGDLGTDLKGNPTLSSSLFWSPDSQQIAFYAYYKPRLEPAIYAVDADGSNIQVADLGEEAIEGISWSPDSNYLAFTTSIRHLLPSIIAVSDRHLKRIHFLTNEEGRYATCAPCVSDYSPLWSPNNQSIAFMSLRDGTNAIYVISPDGGHEIRVTNTSAAISIPFWSPNGKQIAFVSEQDGNKEIYVMNADGSNQLRLTNNTVDDFDPVWSPQLKDK